MNNITVPCVKAVRRRLALGSVLFATLAAPAAYAQTTVPSASDMRVQGPRPVDPRLRAQPDPRLRQPIPDPRLRQNQIPTAPAIPEADDLDDEADTAPLPAAQPGLQRPSYLQPQGGGPATGPSALDLMKQCFDGSISGTISDPSCVGYMSGYIGAIRIAATSVDVFPICLPESGIPNEAIVSDVSAYLEANPDALQKSARSVMFLVLSKRFACKTS